MDLISRPSFLSALRSECCITYVGVVFFYESETPMRIAMLRRRHRLRGLGDAMRTASMLFGRKRKESNVVIRV